MSILHKKKSKISLFRNHDDYACFRTKDMIIDHTDDYHVRFYKLFPFCNEAQEPSLQSFKRFHLRFYIPQNVYQDKYRKIDKCFIFFNGLDELSHFTLYDQIGKGLCKQGYAAILLPLPDHLNRNMKYRYNDPSKEKVPSQSFINEPGKIYDAYLQAIGELKLLLTHLKSECEHKNVKNCCAFYSQFFSKDASISLLGYSIGGLVALSNYLIHKDFNSCVLLNSGAKLEDIDVSLFQSKQEWQGTVKNLAKKHYENHSHSETHKLFNMIFLGNDHSLLKDELKENSKESLFIISGADSVTKYRSIRRIEPDRHGLAILKLPGIHHFLSIDTQWDQWFPMVNETIRCFDESAMNASLLPNDILGELSYYQQKYNISDRANHISIDRVTDDSERDALMRTVFAAKSTYGNIKVALLEMYNLIDRAHKSPNLYTNYTLRQHSNLFCRIACEKYDIDKKYIQKALRHQHDCAVKDVDIPRIGDLLKAENVLNDEQINNILSS